MPRARMIKPEFCTSKTLNNISLESNLLFIMIWMHSDDYGTILNSVRRIFGECFPLRNDVTEKQVSKWLNELVDNKLLIPVSHNGNELLVCRSWEEHQKVPNISKRNNIDNDMSSDEIRLKIEELIQPYLESNESLMRQKLLKEKENVNKNDKEKEKDKKQKSEFPPPPTLDEFKTIFYEELHKHLNEIKKHHYYTDEAKSISYYLQFYEYCTERYNGEHKGKKPYTNYRSAIRKVIQRDIHDTKKLKNWNYDENIHQYKPKEVYEVPKQTAEEKAQTAKLMAEIKKKYNRSV